MFAQLDTKTVFTFMGSLMTIPRYIKHAKELGYTHIGIMDVDNLYGAFSFLEACKDAAITPLIGMELTVEHEGSFFSLRILALTTRGYQNLMKIATLRQTGSRIWKDFIHLMKEVAIIVPYQEDIDTVDLGVDFYVGVRPDSPLTSTVHKSIPLKTVRYQDSGDLEALQMLAAIKDNVDLREVGPLPKNDGLLSARDLAQSYSVYHQEAIDNLSELIEHIHYDIDSNLKLPRFNTGRLAVEELREKAEEGLVSKKLQSKIYQERLNLELSVIHRMGFDDYFLIVWDLIRFGRSQGYYMGMGRGSAVGSLVAYALDITGIDPVANNLLFERFLNLERYTMPDIDIDIPDIYRPNFIRYVRDRYGTQHAAQIVTFSTFGAKQAIRDVFKRFGVPEYELTNITRKISFRDSLVTAYNHNLSFRQIINSKIEYQKAFEIAKKIEGNPRQTSIHAAGVVMSDAVLTDYIPLKYGEDMYITQYDAHGVENNGLLKMDFLGLRNLTFVQRMKEVVLTKYEVSIDISSINLEDPDTLALFARGDTKGIFQFEQAGAINLLRRVQPTCFEEVVATTSLNRPGASDYIDNFVNRKHGKEKVELIDSSLADILTSTYGIMLYQEQVMQVAQRFGGFSLGRADILRRAMGKKDISEMHRMEAEFITGAQKLGHSESKARQVFAIMEKFAGYGFNRSHAYAYSALAFQMAYFKTHYPDVFFDVLLNYSSGDYIKDALESGFSLARLSINNIPYLDKFDKKNIYLGLKNIKGLSKDFAYWIIENRPFSSVEEFILKLPESYQKIPLLTPLVQLGLFDNFESNRQKILVNLQRLFEFSEQLSSLFAEESYSWLESEDFTVAEKYRMEQEILGVGLSPHPLKILAQNSTEPFSMISDLVEHAKVTILVEIEDIHAIRTKNGEKMAFLKVTDTVNQLDVVVFSTTYQETGYTLKQGYYYLSGRVRKRDGKLQLALEDVHEAVSERFWIQVEEHKHDKEIAKILRKFSGSIPVILRYEKDKETVVLPNIRVQKDEQLQEELKRVTLKTVFR
ncbi:DNA polymerase III alpha subunit [Streptococcus sp. DD10]|uniref:DNA polymerase III subunit alpha n=1 Tax=Streptococcus sp. DD10 TaxID=1777878 RepID=UPI0007964B8C|nr:DNA polymerase III subunit alpha [Streptococcus sp. DD10]KXT75253.1 DNA polymerase III alpha subunit [Streptococcus sp. DD10]